MKKKLIEEKTAAQTRRHADEVECKSDLVSAADRLLKLDFPLENVQGIVLSTYSTDGISADYGNMSTAIRYRSPREDLGELKEA